MDVWPGVASTSRITPPSTPRASRTKGTTNDIPYPSFLRDGTTTFRIGEAVIISAKVCMQQKWLQTPASYLKFKSVKNSKGKDKPKKGRRVEEDATGWSHKDGLEGAERVALIIGLFEDAAGCMNARLRWFARPGAVWGEEGPEEDEKVEDYELYYTADSSYLQEVRERRSWVLGDLSTVASHRAVKTPLCTDVLPIKYITRHAYILTPSEFAEQPIKRPFSSRTFVVKKVFDAKPIEDAEFMGEVDWSEIIRKGMEEGSWDTEPVMGEEDEEDRALMRRKRAREEKVQERKERSKRRKLEQLEANLGESDDEESDDGENFEGAVSTEEEDENINDTIPGESDTEPIQLLTPQKEGKGSRSKSDKAISSPNKRIRTTRPQNAINRASVRAGKRKAFKGKQRQNLGLPPTFTTSPEFAKLSDFNKAKALLHVSATPENLPCREGERAKISDILGDAILSSSGTCLYIHGVPGTGKTATVYSVVRALQDDPDMDQFQFVEINGMKLPDPNAAFSVLWQALSGQKAAPRQALFHLERHFQTPDPTRKTTVLLVDELDQMITKKQDVIYNFFNWPHVAHSRLIVIAIANTMDLPERELSGKIRSRLGSNRIPFPSYSHHDLEAILKARLGDLKVFMPVALGLLSRKVAGVSGDARRVLDIARRTVEMVDQHNRDRKEKELCSATDLNEMYKEMTNYGSAAFLEQTSMHQKILLLGLSQCIRRSGLPEVALIDVMKWHLDFLRQTAITPIPTQSDLFTIVAQLHSLRLLGTESQRDDYYQRVRSLVDDTDLFAVLKEEKRLSHHVPRLS